MDVEMEVRGLYLYTAEVLNLDAVFQKVSARYRVVELSSGSNVIPRQARPGLAGLMPHRGAMRQHSGFSTRKSGLCPQAFPRFRDESQMLLSRIAEVFRSPLPNEHGT